MSERLHGVHEDRVGVRRGMAITFPSGRCGMLWLALMVPSSLTGCATAPHVAQAPPAAALPGGPDEGVIALIRPIPPESFAAQDPRGAILAAMGASAAMPDAGTGGAVEVIVHTDDGEMRSVVVGDRSGLVPGERVMILRGGTSRLLPLPSSPASPRS